MTICLGCIHLFIQFIWTEAFFMPIYVGGRPILQGRNEVILNMWCPKAPMGNYGSEDGFKPRVKKCKWRKLNDLLKE